MSESLDDLGMCGAPFCDRPAIAYVARRHGSGRVIVIPGHRAIELATQDVLALRCLDCVHHEVDLGLMTGTRS